jgi:hypothetical protein
VTLVLSLLLLIVIGGGVFFLYRGGVRGANDAPRPVGVPIGAVGTAEAGQPQSADPAAGLSIYKDSSNTVDAAPAFAPPPETPTARPTQAAAPVAPAVPPPAAAPMRVATAADAPAPAAKAPVKAARQAPTSASEDAVGALADASPKAPAADVAKTAPSSGSAVVQIGAFSSPLQADEGWNAAAGVAPAAMAGKGKKVETVARGGSTLYRTSITGFASRQEAQALCEKLQAAGKNCFVR